MLAYEIQERATLEPNSPEGIYQMKLALTGDENLARAARTEAQKILLEASLGGTPISE